MAKRFDLFYGPSGSGKSRAIIELAKHIHEQTGKIARIYIGDGSREMYENSGLVDSGVIKLFEFWGRPEPFSTLQQISEGFWPANPDDPASPMVKLTPKEVAETALWTFEGMSVGGQYLLGDQPGGLAYRAGEGEIIGQDTNIKFTDKLSKKNFGGNPGSHYAVAQRHLHADIKRTKGFPGWVIWTSHERVSDGEKGGAFAKGSTGVKTRVGEQEIGPEVVGQAMTPLIARDFGNTLHFTQASKKIADGTDPVSGKTLYKEVMEYRIYAKRHYDADGIVGLPYIAVNRAMDPSTIKDYYTSEKPGGGLLDFYADLQKGSVTTKT